MIKFNRHVFLLVILVCVVISFSGCALLTLPITILELLIRLAEALPKPPPGVF